MTVADIEETYRPYGGNSQLFTSKQPELILSGPAGTGKSTAILEYINWRAMEWPGARCLMVRKTRRSLGESGMVTFEQKVLHPAQGVRFHGGKQQYQYRNGSILAVGGMDKPSKIMSTDWDLIYFQEATEGDEEDWEICTIRLRWGCLPLQQMLGDCNPAQSTHWILQRARDAKTVMYETRHEDNPLLFNRDGVMTPEGQRYLSKLDNLTGVRYARYRLGLWVSAENMVYEQEWDRKRVVVNNFHIPKEWPRYLAVDFGFTHPFVCLWAAIDPDGRIIIYRQIYKTKTLVEDHAETIKQVSRWGKPDGDPLPRAIIVDHDPEDYKTLERHLGMFTTPAHKSVSDGIQAVASRFRAAGDGKSRIQIMRDCLLERDRDLAEGKQPTCLEDEPESYVWDTRQNMKRGEQPVKESDHALDALRYLTAYFDLVPSTVRYSQRIY